ncbi:transmembrane protein 268 [Brachyhypopomus gauderio]|uniref:transmembrane protein 268 n=1 Tax=Brachyhypopomus gauderio TaxID=698409 RepID=UPI00404346F6
MEERTPCWTEERSETVLRISSADSSPSSERRSRDFTRPNGQCVLAVFSSSMVTPRFDLERCRTRLEKEGFQIPAEDFEIPLRIALDRPSVRRFLFFNSSLFHFIMAPFMYAVLWCAVYSSLHQFLAQSSLDFWVLCLCVSLIATFITITIIFILHYRSKEINVNTDVRLVQVNERLVRYGLLMGVSDWVQQCSGKMQLFCVFWNLSPCLQTLAQTLEELSFVRSEIQDKLKKRMSHLLLVAEVTTPEPVDGPLSEEPDEERPLLVDSNRENTSPRQREEAKLTRNYSLIPDCALSCQAIAYQLLMTYSAVYVKLLASERLPSRPLVAEREHCKTAHMCLCQYVQYKILQ